jgi:hypothetical protein
VPAPAPVAAARPGSSAARVAAVALAALPLAGCLSSPATPITNVVVYWQFQRATFVDGIAGTVAYDADPQHPPVASGRCPQSEIDTVEIRDGAGQIVLPSTPCVTGGIQGANLVGYPEGPRTLVLRAFRDGVPDTLYAGEARVEVLAGPAIPVSIVAVGVPDALSFQVVPVGGGAGPATCGAADVQRLDDTLRDVAGTVVWRNPVPCAPADPLALALGPVDRDAYLVWVAAVRTSASPGGEVVASACAVPISHYGPQVMDVALAPGTCAPPR